MQYVITSSAGKRLIGKATADELFKSEAIKTGTIVIIAGTTNGFVAEELLTLINQTDGFTRKNFFRGVTTPPNIRTTDAGRLPDETEFAGDVVIKNGKWLKGKTINDMVDSLKKGDIIVKGANCVDTIRKKAGILIGHPSGGTIVTSLQAIVGRRVKLLLPVGLEKRVSDDIDSIIRTVNSQNSVGFRLISVVGDIITEIEAINYLTGAKATLFSAGGVMGAEGAIYINIEGEQKSIDKAKLLLDQVINEPPFTF